MPGGTDSGFGVSISFASGFLAEIISADMDWTREAIETTHAGTTNGAATFMPSDIIDYGSLDVEIAHDPSASPPISSAAETVTVTYPVKAGDSTAANWSFSGFLTGYSTSVPIDDRMTASATIKVTGEPTLTAAT